MSSLNRNKEVSKAKNLLVASIFIGVSSGILIHSENRNLSIREDYFLSYHKNIIENTNQKIIREKENVIFEQIAKEKGNKVRQEQEEKERMKDYTYRTIKELKQKTNLNVVDFEEYTFEISFYSDLNYENGYGNLTANGETLKSGMVANNFLPFDTKVFIEGYGTKRVTDRGSEKYFTDVTKFDVFVPRNTGESDKEYYKRVNNLGRKKVKGFILKIEDEK